MARDRSVRSVLILGALALAALGAKARLAAPADSLSWSADGRYVVAAAKRGPTLRLDTRGKAIEVEGVSDLKHAALSQDGRLVLGAGAEGFVVADVDAGTVQDVPVAERDGKPIALYQGAGGEVSVTKTVAHFQVKRTGARAGDPNPEPTKNFQELWLDPTEPLIYVDTGFGLEIRHLWTGRVLRVLDGGRKDQQVIGAVRDADGRLVIALHDEDGFRIWTPPDPPGPSWSLDPAAPVSLSGDGLQVAVGGPGGVELYGTVRREPRAALKTKSPVVKVAFAPDGGHVAASLEDGTLKVWEVDHDGLPTPVDRAVTDVDVGRIRPEAVTGGRAPVSQPEGQFALSGAAAFVGWAPDGRLSGWVGGRLVHIDPDTGAESPIKVPELARGRPYAWSADGALLAASTATGVVLVDPRKGKAVKTLQTGGNHNQLEWRGASLVVDAASARAQAWDPTQGQALGEPYSTSPDATARFVASPDGQLLAVRGRVAQVVHSRSGRVIAALDAQFGGVSAVAWSPDAKRLATAGNDGTVLLWDTSTWEPVALLEGAHGRDLVFSPDGGKLLSASWEGAVIANVATGQLEQELPFSGLLASIDWGPGGIVMCDNAGNLYRWR